jgi:hypothetical protein
VEAPEEVRARATLEQMQLRISHGPYAALGVTEGASADDVRTAFLGLTKQFHPARFARMSPELHRLSNEVFIGIKTAHDALMKQLGASRAQQSGGMPAISAEGTGRVPVQRARGTERPGPPTRMPTGPQPTVARTPTPTGMPPVKPPTGPQPRLPTAQIPRVQSEPVRTPTGQIPRVQSEPVRTPTGQVPRVLPRTQTEPIRGGTQPFRGVAPPPQPTRPATPPGTRPGTPPSPQPNNPDTVRHAGLPKEPPFDERAALRESLMLLNEQNWAGARQVLQNLAARVPASKNYRALLGYARGREAQAAGRIEDASLEFQRALQLDPELSLAKAALAEVQRRR